MRLPDRDMPPPARPDDTRATEATAVQGERAR
jgi:hypothetical protein